MEVDLRRPTPHPVHTRELGFVSVGEGSDIYVCRRYHVVSLSETIEVISSIALRVLCGLCPFDFFEGEALSAGNN